MQTQERPDEASRTKSPPPPHKPMPQVPMPLVKELLEMREKIGKLEGMMEVLLRQ